MGILLAFRRLALSSELDVLRAVGWSYARLLRVPFIITGIMAAANFFILGYLQPLALYYYEELQFDLRSGAMGAAIKVGEFTTLEDRIGLRIERSEDDGRELYGIFARVRAEDGQTFAFSAREGRFMANEDNRDTIILHLVDGVVVQDVPDGNSRVLSFAQHDLPIDLPALESFRKRGSNDREYVLPELLRIGWSDRAPEETRVEAQAMFNFRMSEVLTMFLLPLLAVAMAVPPKRSSSAVGIFVAVILVVAFHKLNEYGAALASLGRLDPWVALVGPLALFTLLIVWMYRQIAHVPGGQPLGWLDRIADTAGKRLRKLLRRRTGLGPIDEVQAELDEAAGTHRGGRLSGAA